MHKNTKINKLRVQGGVSVSRQIETLYVTNELVIHNHILQYYIKVTGTSKVTWTYTEHITHDEWTERITFTHIKHFEHAT